MSLKDRVVLITGATGGLGQVASREFSRQQALLVLAAKSREKLDDLAGKLGQTPDRYLLYAADLTKSTSASSLVEAAVRKFGRLDVLLHLVGGWIGGSAVEELDEADVETMLQQHLWTTVRLAKAVVPHMRQGGWGRILAVSSPTATRPPAKRAPYAIGKAAEEALLLTLAQELKGTGVTANLVVVNTIDTADERKNKPDAKNASWATPAEITATLLHLCSDEAVMINGARIPLYGG